MRSHVTIVLFTVLFTMVASVSASDPEDVVFSELMYNPGAGTLSDPESLGLEYVELPSYAAHDAGVMASITPSGMFFVPSVSGASHSPRELTLDEDCVNAGNVMLHTVLRLCGN